MKGRGPDSRCHVPNEISIALEIFVLAFQNVIYFVAICRPHQHFFKGLVFENSGYPGQHLQVQPRGVFRCHQEKEDVRGPPIYGIEIHTLSTEPEAEEQIIEALQFAVGDADTAPDSGAAQLLPVHQNPNQLFRSHIGMGGDGCYQFFKNPFFIPCRQVGQNGFRL